MNRRAALYGLGLGLLLLMGYAWQAWRSPHSLALPIAIDAAPAPTATAAQSPELFPQVPPKPAPIQATATAQVLWRAHFGDGAADVGRKRDPESNPEAPMALYAGKNGDWVLLDQVNRRVMRFHQDRATAIQTIARDTAQDLALNKDGSVAILDRLGEKQVSVFDASGLPQSRVSLLQAGVGEPGGVTAVLHTDDGLLVERQHQNWINLSDGKSTSLWGRPGRDGQRLLRAAIGNAAIGEVIIESRARNGETVIFRNAFQLAAPILYILLFDSDDSGNIFVGASIAERNNTPPYRPLNERIAVLRIADSGEATGLIELPALNSGDEMLHPLAVDDAGEIYQIGRAHV